MNPRRLYRSHDRRLAGVAGGMAEYLDIDPTVVRLLWVLAIFASAGFAILAYILSAIIIPNAPWAAGPNGQQWYGAPAGAQPMWGQAPQQGWGYQQQPPTGWAPAPPTGPVAPPAASAQAQPAAEAVAGEAVVEPSPATSVSDDATTAI